MPIPPVPLLAPPVARVPEGPIAPKLEGAPTEARRAGEAHREVAATMGCVFFDVASVTETSAMDGVLVRADRVGASVKRPPPASRCC